MEFNPAAPMFRATSLTTAAASWAAPTRAKNNKTAIAANVRFHIVPSRRPRNEIPCPNCDEGLSLGGIGSVFQIEVANLIVRGAPEPYAPPVGIQEQLSNG